jgi:hypothetical protein
MSTGPDSTGNRYGGTFGSGDSDVGFESRRVETPPLRSPVTDSFGSGLFGGPSADLFGGRGLVDSGSEPGYYTSPGIKREHDPTAETGSLVRPYTRTGGRTRPDYDLAIEALVSTSERGRGRQAAVLPEHRSICGLCLETRSVAEVAAHLRLPLGVVRVLVGDMAGMGLVLIHQSDLVKGDRPSIDFLERVLSGLRRL